MKNEQNELEQSHLAGGSSRQEQGVTVSSRRRLLRAGLKATPIIVATLASRPSLACHCIVPSAWGSIKAADHTKFDQDIQNKALQGSLARYNNVVRTGFDPYRFGDFSLSTSSGWLDLRTIVDNAKAFPKRKDGSDRFDSDQKLSYLQGTLKDPNTDLKLTVSGLCALLGIKVPNGSGGFYPLNMINGTSSEKRFGAAMFIALLNRRESKLPPDCLTSTTNGDILNDMVDGSYLPVGVSTAWGKPQIVEYLHYNWFAHRS